MIDKSIRLRLGEFSGLTGDPRETVRSIIAGDEGPIAREIEGQSGQRTYDGMDMIRWSGFQALREAGLSAYHAAKMMRYSGAVDAFLEALEAGQDVTDFCLIFGKDYPHPATGFYELYYKFGHSADVAALAKQWEAEGKATRYVVAVPFWQIYLNLLARVREEGFALEGSELVLGDA